MRHMRLFYLIFLTVFLISSAQGQQKYNTTISYAEGSNSGTVKFATSFDNMMGSLLIKAVAKVESHEGCEPGILNVTVDIYDGSTKVSSKTFSNLISTDISGSPDWDEAFPGLNEDQAKDLYKRGFTIKNARMSNLSFPGCDSGSNSAEEDKEEEKEDEDEDEKGEDKENVEPSEKSSSTNHSQQLNEKKRQEEEAAKRERERRAENQRKKREYDQRIAEQRNRNVEQASAMAAANMGAFIAIAMVLYKDMGEVSSSDTYFGNQFNFGINMGYSLSSIPMVFNSETTTYIYDYYDGNNEYITKKEDDDRRTSTLNMDFKPFFGYEHDYGGVDLYACIQPGTSIIFDRTNFSHYLGGEVFGGLKNVKLFYSFNRGARRFYSFNWINPEEYGSGGSRYKYKKQMFGLKFSWEANGYNYARHHLKIGYIYENFLEAIDHDDGNSRLWHYDLDPTLELDPDKYYRIKGFHVSWVKEHNFDFYANIYSNHPYTGINKFPDSKSFKDRDEGALFFEVGFVRQIKKFF